MKIHRTADAHMAGDFMQGGNTTPLVLEKTGPAEVDFPPKNTSVSKQLEGEW